MANETTEDRLMNAGEVADYTGISESSVRKKALAGEIPSVKLGAAQNAPRRFWRSEVTDWIESHRKEG